MKRLLPSADYDLCRLLSFATLIDGNLNETRPNNCLTSNTYTYIYTITGLHAKKCQSFPGIFKWWRICSSTGYTPASFRPIYSVFFFNIYIHKENDLKMTHRLPLSSTILQCLSSLHKNRKWWKEYLLLLWIV